MEAIIRAVVSAALRCRAELGAQARGATDPLELAYAACLLEEATDWGSDSLSLRLAVASRASGSASDTTRGTLTADVVSALAERLAAHSAAARDAASVATAKLQLDTEREHGAQQASLEAQRKERAASAARLATQLARRRTTPASRGLQEYRAAFNEVVEYACAVLSGKAGPTMRSAVAAAVESVLPLSSVAHFMSLPEATRMQQLEELGRVVCGICLFNSAAPASDHGGTCSMAVPAALDATMCTPVHSAQQLLARVRHSAAEAAHSMDMCNNTLPFDSCSSSSDDGHAGVCTSNHVGRALFACQAALLLRQLGDDVAAVLDLCVKLQTGVHEMLGKAAALVASCGAHGVPKDDVLPLFEAAGRFHLALSDEAQQLLLCERIYDHICAALEAAAAAAPASVPRVLGMQRRKNSSAGNNSCLNRHVQLCAQQQPEEQLEEHVQIAPSSGVEYLPPQDTHSCSEGCSGGDDDGPPDCINARINSMSCSTGPLALGGLCATSLAGSAVGAAAGRSHGPGTAAVARLADPQFGFLRYRGMIFGFSSTSALRCFAAAPEATLEGVRRAVQRAPLLAHMLRVTGPLVRGISDSTSSNDSSSSSSSSGSVSGASYSLPGAPVAVPPLQQLIAMLDSTPLLVETGVQTLTHTDDGKWDWQYEWNEWALRRKIIALANLRRKATHGAQTLLSHFRREGSSQVWVPKVAASQTAVHKSSTMPRRMRYAAGLRGAPGAGRVHVVSLELDIGQTLQY